MSLGKNTTHPAISIALLRCEMEGLMPPTLDPDPPWPGRAVEYTVHSSRPANGQLGTPRKVFLCVCCWTRHCRCYCVK